MRKLCQTDLNKISYAMAIRRNENEAKKNSDWRICGRASRLRYDNRPAISGLHPIEHERHGREQWSAIALKLIFGYLNCMPSNIVVKYI